MTHSGYSSSPLVQAALNAINPLLDWTVQNQGRVNAATRVFDETPNEFAAFSGTPVS